MKKIFLLFPLICALCLLTRKACADEVMIQMLQSNMQTMQETMKGLQKTIASQNEVIEKLNTRIGVLERSDGQPVSVPEQTPERATKTAGLSQGINPDIGVIGNVQAQLTENTADGEGRDTVALKELEISFSQYVDPYSRFDVILALNDNLESQNIDIEEAYYTHWGLPFGFQGQAGKFRSKIGKINLLHLHYLENTDYPEIIKNFFGDEGLSSSGVRLQNMIPNPWDIPIEVTGEVLRGNNGRSFGGKSRRLIFNTHLKTFFELNDDTALGLGGTTMFGEQNASGLAKGDDRFGTHIFGGDATVIWNGPAGRMVKWQNEVFYQERESTAAFLNDNPWGFYSLFDVRLNKQWSAGARFDYVRPLEITDQYEQTYAISPYITFWQSEFASFSVQYTHKEPANPVEKTDEMIFLEANSLIGQHKHPVQ
ncbi:MAG: hypothetical protein HY587_02210 [Candidatus Omnitrophica bacterium]|nr:hypothetical protein [Candidatus Omnitrophota bacterium]